MPGARTVQNGTQPTLPPSGNGAAPVAPNALPFPAVHSPAPIAARYGRRGRRAAWKTALIWVFILGVAAGTVYASWDRFLDTLAAAGFMEPRVADSSRPEHPDSPSTDRSDGTGPDQPAVSAPAPAKPTDRPPAPFPRRLLAVSVNNYLYANPINYGSADEDETLLENQRVKRPDRSLHAVCTRLAEALRIPTSQVTELSDAAPRGLARPPLKPVIESTIADFLDTCRPQDRIILLFIGHMVELGGENFLVPIEGELGLKETLIPLAWLYDRLAKCKAQQKVLIMDVCRYNPARGLERPGPGPMGAKLDEALKNPPPGVQVWSACMAGQYSYEGAIELPDRSLAISGYFINELFEAVGSSKKRVNLGIQNPEDPLPLDLLAKGDERAKGVQAGTEFEVNDWYQQKQTPRLSGQALVSSGAYNPAEPLPEPLVIKMPPPPPGGAADRELVQAILRETDAKMTREGSLPLRVDALPPFDAKRLADYTDDGVRTPFREEILKVTALLQKHQQTFKEDFRGNGNDATIKKIILERQQKPARAFAELMDELETLKEVGAERKKEKSKRWLADYDFVLAKLEGRLAYVYEYNYLLGQIRKDALPPRDPAKHSGWRLAAQEKLQSGSEARKLATDAKKLLTKIVAEHPGTPWEILAKRQSLTTLGLKWEPTP
jgi:hypothetical protein